MICPRAKSGLFFISCSQISTTFHFCFLSSFFTIMRLFLLFSILLLQNPTFVLGSLKHVLHPCQKHPSMKIASFFFFIDTSGEPNTVQSWILYLTPRLHNIFLIMSSGFVFLPLMLAITLLLFSFERLSTICVSNYILVKSFKRFQEIFLFNKRLEDYMVSFGVF